jgi:hypothetical protein
MSRTIIVKCIRCGTEYEMPDIDVQPVMQNCPICRDIDRQLQNILGEFDNHPEESKNVE